jgi:hypothetical protein
LAGDAIRVEDDENEAVEGKFHGMSYLLLPFFSGGSDCALDVSSGRACYQSSYSGDRWNLLSAERADNVLELRGLRVKTCVYCLWAKPYLYKDFGVPSKRCLLQET